MLQSCLCRWEMFCCQMTDFFFMLNDPLNYLYWNLASLCSTHKNIFGQQKDRDMVLYLLYYFCVCLSSHTQKNTAVTSISFTNSSTGKFLYFPLPVWVSGWWPMYIIIFAQLGHSSIVLLFDLELEMLWFLSCLRFLSFRGPPFQFDVWTWTRSLCLRLCCSLKLFPATLIKRAIKIHSPSSYRHYLV